MPQIFPMDSHEAYRQALKAGRKYLTEQHSRGRSGLLEALESLQRDTCSEIPLGLVEIPLKKIRGTFAAGRQSAFSGNFMPILDESTEFASKWSNLFSHHIEEGIRDPIKAYEYLGHYYVIEGNKRVSVLAFSGAYSALGEVTRLLPSPDEQSPEISVFYEIIGDNKRAPLGDMWFSAPGRITKLRKAATEAASRHPGWPEGFMKIAFSEFKSAYHELGLDSLPLTTGDAFHEYVEVFGFPYGARRAKLMENIKNCLPQFKLIGAEISSNTMSDTADLSDLLVKRTNLIALLLGRTQRLSVAFAYYGDPETHFFAKAHEAGRLLLSAQYPEVDISVLSGLPQGKNAYNAMSEFVTDNCPDVLFSTDPMLAPAALRVALEAKGVTVLQCQEPKDDSFLPTYYGKTEEAAFLCGVLAGSLTRTGSVGTIKGRSATGVRSSDVQAFAQGARSARPSARVHYLDPANRGIAGRRGAQETLAAHGCDIIWLPYIPNAPCQRKAFPGLIGHLCAIDPAGNVVYYYASVAWHWDVFYTGLIGLIADPSTEMPHRRSGYHFRLGAPSGLLRVHPLYPAIQPWSRRLLAGFETLLASGEIKPIDENMTVEILED